MGINSDIEFYPSQGYYPGRGSLITTHILIDTWVELRYPHNIGFRVVPWWCQQAHLLCLCEGALKHNKRNRNRLLYIFHLN